MDTVLSNPPPARCRACDTPLPPNSTTCSHCGAVFGEADRCPHCRVIAGVDVQAGIGRCRVCGGPRIALADSGIARSGRENELLAQARSLSLGIAATRVFAYGALGSSALGLVFALMLGVALHSLAAPLAVAFVATLMGVLGFTLARRARLTKKEQEDALEKALVLVAADVMAQRPALESAELGRMIGVNPEKAELLAAELDVDRLLQPDESARNAQRLPDGEVFAEPDGAPATQMAPQLDVTQSAPPLARLDRRS